MVHNFAIKAFQNFPITSISLQYNIFVLHVILKNLKKSFGEKTLPKFKNKKIFHKKL